MFNFKFLYFQIFSILALLISADLNADTLIRGEGRAPEGSHCLAYVFTQLAREQKLSMVYQSSQTWIDLISKKKSATKIKSFQTWEKETGVQLITLIEPSKESIALPENEILLWVGIIHPRLNPYRKLKVTNPHEEEPMHATTLEIVNGIPNLKHYGPDNKPIYIEIPSWDDFTERTKGVYQLVK